MNLRQALAFVDQLASLSVFQMAIGGGEPFLRDDLSDIAAHANESGVIVNITTNGLLVSREDLARIRPNIGKLQSSIDPPSEKLRGNEAFKRAVRGARLVAEEGIPFGVNLIVTRANVEHIERALRFYAELGASGVILLRPKPDAHQTHWWIDGAPRPQQYERLRRRPGEIKEKYPDVQIRVDCALSFLMRDLDPERSRFLGIRGCSAGARFCHVIPDGRVFPCAPFVKDSWCAGNILEKPLADL